MGPTVSKRVEDVREALNRAGRGLGREDWRELLVTIGDDIDAHLDAVREEEAEEAEEQHEPRSHNG